MRFGKGGPALVLKLFWDTAPTPPHYFAAQRECQNNALFHMMQAAISDKTKLGPILVNPCPESKEVAEANLFAFSDEGRARNKALQSTENLVEIKEMPRMRQCFGWMRFTGEELLRRLPAKLRPLPIKIDKVERSIDKHLTYTALVYEFIDSGANDPAVVQKVLDFLWCVGFAHRSHGQRTGRAEFCLIIQTLCIVTV
ncbi:hypothetical protein G6O67_001707 [Ophiocordyceps sinensis]|uniref:Uncharacterized protein n=1 Tax=Ophiocordyceps sinensis TaxID=72228 RepID=A0A8H4PY36_9HYPO|nr:hypothetical protein G6O67_001707 [Ophiocordyceps sinensis]